MYNLIRWNPYREMSILRNAMDRLVDSDQFEMLSGQPRNWGLALDVSENEDEFVVKASLPGVKPEDIEITYDKQILTIKGEIKQESEEEDENRRYYVRERRYGNFCRSLSLPAAIKADAIEAAYEAGVLSLSLPKTEEAKPKRIQVKSLDASKLIEG
ncbi:MAG: Hsp20/alpha crystallin family protein [Anaerolineales bacterium]|nr:Hsp20/alpha crystallin family protein [Anaerolineales bacterium]